MVGTRRTSAFIIYLHFPQNMTLDKSIERLAVYVFGVVFVSIMVVIAIAIPEPTEFQYTVFRIVLALAAAGIAAFLPGFIHVEISKYVRAGEAIGVFIVVYFFTPAQLVIIPPDKTPRFVGVEVLKQKRFLDLSDWQLVDIKDRDEPISKGIFNDSYELIKVRDDSRYFIGHHGTTGLKIDFSSDSHNIEVKDGLKEIMKGLRSLKKYDVYLDISKEPIDSPFFLHLRAIYWNAFNSRWAATPVMFPTKYLVFSLKFPKPISSFSLSSFRRASGAVPKPYRGKGSANLSNDKTLLKWTVPSPNLNYIYQVNWTW